MGIYNKCNNDETYFCYWFQIQILLSFSRFSTKKRSGSWSGTYIPKGWIQCFTNIQINHENGFNGNTGTFTVPVTGIYLFMFQSHVQRGKLINLINIK